VYFRVRSRLVPEPIYAGACLETSSPAICSSVPAGSVTRTAHPCSTCEREGREGGKGWKGEGEGREEEKEGEKRKGDEEICLIKRKKKSKCGERGEEDDSDDWESDYEGVAGQESPGAAGRSGGVSLGDGNSEVDP